VNVRSSVAVAGSFGSGARKTSSVSGNWVNVGVCSGACADPMLARYRLFVEINGVPAALALVANDVPLR
jgi:hypothetical protein